MSKKKEYSWGECADKCDIYIAWGVNGVVWIYIFHALIFFYPQISPYGKTVSMIFTACALLVALKWLFRMHVREGATGRS